MQEKKPHSYNPNNNRTNKKKLASIHEAIEREVCGNSINPIKVGPSDQRFCSVHYENKCRRNIPGILHCVC